MDWSWSWETKMPRMHRGSGLLVEFIDPVGGKVLATHEISAECE